MTAASSLPVPSSRTLAGWWKQLSTLAPECWWVGRLFIHRVEAAVQVRQTLPNPPLTQAVLHALTVSAAQEVSVTELAETLQFPFPLLLQHLRQLSRQGLVEAAASTHWRLTQAGRAAGASQNTQSTVSQRKVFSFAELRDSAGGRTHAPYFLPLDGTTASRPWQANEDFPFDVAWLQACVGQDVAWKQQQGFPVEVERLLSVETHNGSDLPLAWRNIVVDRLEEVSLVLVQAGSEPRHLLGFAFSPATWTLELQQPLLRRPLDATPPLFEGLTRQAMRDAWLAWAKLRNLPLHDVEGCDLSLEGVSLRVRGSQRLADILRQTKSDILKGEAWVLIGNADIRRAARLEFIGG